MSLWGRILGTPDTLTEVVKAGRDGLDALVYTDEEKAKDAAAAVTEARAIVVKWMESTQGQNLARRLLALIITAVWLLMYLGAMMLDISALWVDDPARIIESSKRLGVRAYEMNGAMMLILGFYFAAPHMSSIVEAAMGKFSGKQPPKG